MASPLRILHLEDSPRDAELIGIHLKTEGLPCDITAAANGDEFLSTLRKQRFDLILSDYTIPGFDGLSALTAAQSICPETPFIFVSGTIGEESAILTLQCGATDYVVKDRLGRLVPAIHRALREAQERSRTKRIEEKIREQATLLDIVHDAILLLDAQHTIQYWSKGAERLYGYWTTEVLGKPVWDVFACPASDVDQAVRSLNAHGTWQGEFTHATREGKTISVDSRWSVVRGDKGELKAILIVNHDISERKQYEQQLLRAQRIESLGTLAGGIAHDLNNVLAPIIVALQLLRMRWTDEVSQNWLDMLESSAQRGAELVKQILAFTCGLDGTQSIVQIYELVAEVAKMAKETFPSSIHIQTDVPSDLSLIQGNKIQLYQVLLNLAVNGRDAMPHGGTLAFTAKNETITAQGTTGQWFGVEAGDYVVISVTDTGSGIPPDIVEKIFEPFFTTKEAGKGSGLGLSTAAGIVKQHKGFITVSSRLQQGTEFKVFLPTMPRVDVPHSGKEAAVLPLGQGELLMLVDDEEAILEMTKQTLEAFNYQVVTAQDGAEAVALYSQRQTELAAVILDMSMPYLDGPATVRALRKLDPAVRIIGVTGASGEAQLNIPFLRKPFSAEDLLTLVRQVVDTSRLARG